MHSDENSWAARGEAASGPYKVNSLVLTAESDPVEGSVHWDPPRSIWNAGMLLAALVLGPLYFSWSAFLVFLLFLEFTMCAGHSVGFHRRLIHRTFRCPKWLERVLVY